MQVSIQEATLSSSPLHDISVTMGSTNYSSPRIPRLQVNSRVSRSDKLSIFHPHTLLPSCLLINVLGDTLGSFVCYFREECLVDSSVICALAGNWNGLKVGYTGFVGFSGPVELLV
jgi:hypothetical protein